MLTISSMLEPFVGHIDVIQRNVIRNCSVGFMSYAIGFARRVRRSTVELGMDAFCLTLPSVPLRPGPYAWCAVIYDAGGLTDDWECVPQIRVITPFVNNCDDESAGFLNIQLELKILPETFLK